MTKGRVGTVVVGAGHRAWCGTHGLVWDTSNAPPPKHVQQSSPCAGGKHLRSGTESLCVLVDVTACLNFRFWWSSEENKVDE